MLSRFREPFAGTYPGSKPVYACAGPTLLHPRAHSGTPAVALPMLPTAARDAACSESSQPMVARSGFKSDSAYAQGEFQPRLLTHKLQKAEQVEQLQHLWETHNQQFNSIHFSALMKQLEKLHAAAQAGQYTISSNGSQGAFSTVGSADQSPVGGKPCSSEKRKQQPSQAVAAMQQHAAVLEHGALDPSANGQSVRPQQQQQQHGASAGTQQQTGLDAARQLAQNIARAALQPARSKQLDGRALVMITHSLAKVGVADPQLLHNIVQATGHGFLRQLDAQQITNIIWSIAICTLQSRRLQFSSRAPESNSHSSSHSGTGLLGSNSPNKLSRRRFELPHSWLAAAADALQQQLDMCDSAGVAMALWGFAQLGFKPDDSWWSGFWVATQDKLAGYSGQDLSSVMYAVGKLKAKVPDAWLSSYLSASCCVLPSLSPQQLTMSVWGLATAGCQPDKAWLMLWFLESKTSLHRATTQDLSMWLYSLAVLRITPSPLWCTSFVEASFDRLTAANIAPQELANAMWAISCMSWSPPLLYWKGLLDAAAAAFRRFNPHDFANCISAATAVDMSSVEKRWFTAFLQASEPKLSSFLPVHLAHTARSLARILKAHDWACLCIQASWQAAFTQAAAAQLAQGRFSERNLQLVVDGLKQLNFSPATEETRGFLRSAEASLEQLAFNRTQTVLQHRAFL